MMILFAFPPKTSMLLTKTVIKMKLVVFVVGVAVAFALVVVFGVDGLAVLEDSDGPMLVKTTLGPVNGFKTKNARIWRGIPYGAPPVGPMRWADPQFRYPWTSTLNATTFGPACPQDCRLPPLGCQKQQSEDCLFLNVYAPLADGNYPVMVWFHGGRYEQGSEGVELYDPQLVVAENNVVIVTVNYRLGVLGFLAMPEHGLLGNWGSKDQRLSMMWVKENVLGFGGNPNKVMIYGQSAGGTSISYHLTSERSWPLFNSAVLESAPFSLPLLTPASAQEHYSVWASDAGCDPSDLACLRGLNISTVVAAQMTAQTKIWLVRPMVLFFPWTPVVDGDELLYDPFTAIHKGHYSKVPIIIGNVGDESRMFVFEAFSKLNKVEAEALIDVIFRGNGEPKDIMEMYPVPEQLDDYRTYLTPPASDYVIACVSQNISKVISADGVDVFHYVFDHAWIERGGWGPNYTFCEGYPCHAVELPFVFDSATFVDGFQFTDKEQQLANLVSGFWASFATNDKPTSKQGLVWPTFTTQQQNTMLFNLTSTVVTDHRRNYCEFWDNSPNGYVF
eukprot:m.19384 g.19384  ORF g.19384 m.19384 type:complete len:560 (-) comp5105_c0_seq1:307-1986(-)